MCSCANWHYRHLTGAPIGAIGPKGLSDHGLVAPESLVTLTTDTSVLLPVENYESLTAKLDSDFVLGHVFRLVDKNETKLTSNEEVVTCNDVHVAHTAADARDGETTKLRCTRLITMLGLDERANGLSADQYEKLKRLIEENNDVFALDDSELGCTDVVQHVIETEGHPPIKQPIRRLPFVRRAKVSEMVDDMLARGVIQPSASAWSSPIVLVPKKNGDLRFCVDYRRLNKVTRKDVYPLPRIDDILDTLGGTRYFSSLDLCSGYWQIELDPESRPKSAFVTHRGLHEFVRLPFGLCNGPSTFQRLMEIVLSGLAWKNCFVYIDDVLVCSQTFDDHLAHLQQVFDRLRSANLRLNAKKCVLLKDEVHYLGHVVSQAGIYPSSSNVTKVKDYPTPADVSQVRQFLGLASYYRRFIKNFSKIAAPLNALLRKDVSFEWNDACEQSFVELKNCLTSAPVLAYPRFDVNVRFILETDASAQGLGAVLSQTQSDGKVHPIAYASRSLNVHEKNYSATELETLGLVWASRLFRPYLLGHKCVVYTDHAACTSLLDGSHPSAKLVNHSGA